MPSKLSARVAICQPVYAAVDPLCIEALHYLKMQSVDADGEPLVRTYHHVQSRPVEEARNMLTREALKTDATHLLWIDADMVFNADSLEKLLDRDLPFVGGLCYNRWPPYAPVALRRFDPSWALEPSTLGWIYDHPREGLMDVDVTGGAFLLIKREVFKAVFDRESKGDPTWAKWWTPSAYEKAEDFSFCWRAKDAGYDVKIDCSVRIGHIGRVVIDEAFSRRNRRHVGLVAEPMLVPFKRDEVDENEVPIKPVASVIIPVLNQKPEFLRAAVLSALAQTWPVEVIVVDDGCDAEHDVAAILAGRPDTDEQNLLPLVRVVEHPDGKNHGIAASLNRGMSLAQTDWFCWLSSDDLFLPHKVQAQWLAMHDARALVGFHTYNAAMDNGLLIRQPQIHDIPNMDAQRHFLTRSCYINGSTTMIHRSVIDAVGGYDTSFRYSQDWELWCRIGQTFEWHYLSEPLGIRREIAGNGTQAIERDAEKRTLWRAEDARIREMYAPPDFRLLLEKVHGTLSENAWGSLPGWLKDRVQAALNPSGK